MFEYRGLMLAPGVTKLARKPRVHFQGAFYHVIAHGNRRQDVFLDDEDYQLYLDFLRQYKERYRFLLYAYTLMPNHVHLLIEVIETSLSRLMQSLQFRYSRNFNLKYGKSGHLFQGRYKSILCQKDAYLLELSAYIHLNTVRAGLAKDPEEYRWSSYRHYVQDGDGDGLTDTAVLLALLSQKTSLARRKYAAFVTDRLSQGHREDFYQVKGQRFLGSEEFVENIQRSLRDERGAVYDLSLQEIVSKASSALDIPTSLFYSTTRNRQGAWGRAVTGYLARKLGGFQVKAVAEHFARDPAVISQGVKKLEEEVREKAALDRTIAALEEALTRNRRKIPV